MIIFHYRALVCIILASSLLDLVDLTCIFIGKFPNLHFYRKMAHTVNNFKEKSLFLCNRHTKNIYVLSLVINYVFQ